MIVGTLYPDDISPDEGIVLTQFTHDISSYNGVDAYWIGHCVPPSFMDCTLLEFTHTGSYGVENLDITAQNKDVDRNFTWASQPQNSPSGWASIGTSAYQNNPASSGFYDFRLFNQLNSGLVHQYCPVVYYNLAYTCYEDNGGEMRVIAGGVKNIAQYGGGTNDFQELLETLVDDTPIRYNLNINGVIFPIDYSYAGCANEPMEVECTVGNNYVHGYVHISAVWLQGGRDLSTPYDYTTQTGQYTNAFPLVQCGDYLIGSNFAPWDYPIRVNWTTYESPIVSGGRPLTTLQNDRQMFIGGIDGVHVNTIDNWQIWTPGMVWVDGNAVLHTVAEKTFEIHPYLTAGDVKQFCAMFPAIYGVGSPIYSEDYEPNPDEWSDDPTELEPWQSDTQENAYDGDVPEPEPEGGAVIIDGDLIIPDNSTDANGTEPTSDFRTTNLRCMNQFITMDVSGFDALKNKLAESAQSPDVNSFWSKLGSKMFKNDNGNFVLEEVTTETSNNIGSYIVSARVYPFTITGVCPVDNTVKTDIAFGYQGAVLSGVAHYDVTTPYGVIDAGTVRVPTFAQSNNWGSVGYSLTFLDENPYTKTRIILPAIGSFELNPQMVVGHDINVKYGVDLTNGICTAIVTSSKSGTGSDGGTRLLLCKSAKIAYDLTMSGNNLTAQTDNIAVSTLQKQQQSINTAKMQLGVAKDVTTTASQLYSNSKSPVNLMVQSGHAMERIVENMFNIASTSIAEMKVNIDGIIASRDVPQTITHGSSDAGIAGQVAPYIVVQRPRIDNLYNSNLFKNTYGHIANYIGKLETGYNEVVNPRVDIEGATENELAHINSMLRSGVYVR